MGSYWQRAAGWTDRWAATPIPPTVDHAILGGGLAGLMTAIRLRELQPGASILVLEAERVGHGASGRNAGFLSPLAAPAWLLGAERAPEQAWAAAHVNALVHAIARWIAEHVPAAELRPAVLGLQATSRLADGALRELATAVERVGLAHQVTDSRVRPGRRVLEMEAYTVQPYALVRGLAERAVRAGVLVRERARVRAVKALPTGARVTLEDGTSLVADRVTACTNAATSALDLDYTVRTVAVHSFMAATAPIAGPVVRDGDFTVEINTAQSYHRMHGGRIIYGGIDKLRAPAGGDYAVPAQVQARLARQLADSFPGVDARIDEAWSGTFQATATGLPIIRALEALSPVVLNIGYGGTGVALALACAPLAAAIAAGGLVPCSDDARLLAAIHGTKLSVRDSVRTLARMARRAATPWLAA